MKDSGNMKVYHLIREVYEGAIAFTHGMAMKQKILYALNTAAVIAQNPQNENEFFYLTDRRIIKEIAKKIKEKKYIKEINMDVDEFFELLRLGDEREKAAKKFDDKAKSLFDIVTEKALKKAPKGIRGCCD